MQAARLGKPQIHHKVHAHHTSFLVQRPLSYLTTTPSDSTLVVMTSAMNPSATTLPHQPLKRCPELPDGISFATHWFCLYDMDDFWICSKCFEDHVRNTDIANLCKSFYHDPEPGSKGVCDFNTPRVHQLFQAALTSGDIGTFRTFALKRASLGLCQGTSGVRGGQGARWFSNPEIPRLVICEACYEDNVMATTFASKFTLRPLEDHNENEVWSCDLAVPYIKRMLLQSGMQGNWQDFVNAANMRLSLPECTGQPVNGSSRKWLRPTRPAAVENMVICQACFLDQTGGLSAEVNFEYHSPNELEENWICDLKTPAIKVASDELLQTDYLRWHNMVTQIMSKPVCAFGDIKDGDWYHLRNAAGPIPNFDICSTCFFGFFESTGLGHHLQPLRYPVGTVRSCDFSSKNNRTGKFLNKWRQMVFTGSPVHLIDYASRISTLPICSGSNTVKDQVWWGMDDFFFCHSCYEEAGKDTYFAPTFKFQGTHFPEATCDMYTDNMRSRYFRACSQQSLEEFLHYCQERAKVLELLNKQIAFNKSIQQFKSRNAAFNTFITGFQRNTIQMNHGMSAAAHGQS